MKRKILAVIMVLAVVLGTFASTALTASAEMKQFPAGAQVIATVDTGTKTLTFSAPTYSSGSNKIPEMNEFTIGNEPWKELADQIEHIIVEGNIANITAGAGTNLPKLKDISIGKDVSRIDPRAFINSPSVTSFSVVDGNKAFAVSADKQILFNKDADTIIHAAIGSLKNYKISNSIISIAPYAFYGAVKLERITIGNSLVSIGDYAFAGCSVKGDPSDDDAVRVLTIPSNVRIIGAHAFEGNLIERTSFSYNLNTIGESAFEDCTALLTIDKIDNPVMIVEENAFLNTNIKNSSKETDFNGDRYEWADLTANDTTLSGIRYSLKDPQDTEYVAYDVNGGLVTTIPQNQLFVKNAEVTIANVDAADNKIEPEHEKYYFAGWSQEKAKDTVTFTADYLHAGDTFKPKTAVRLYAAWTKDISLIFDANGGTLTEGLSPVRKDDPVENYKLPKAVPTNTKYDFLGWSKDKDAAEPDYLPEGTMNLNKNTILYAVWKVNGPYSITIDANGGEFSDGTTEKILENVKKKGEDYTVSSSDAPAPARARYTFIGWKAENSETSMTPVVKSDYNTTVKAVWSFDGPCYIRYRIDGRIDTAKSEDVAIGNTITIPEAVEKTDYTFKGWKNAGKLYQPGDKLTVTKDYTFDASFEKINHTKDSNISLERKYDIDVDKGSKVHITATVSNVPDGYHFWLYQNGEGITGGPVTDGTATIDWTSDKISKDTNFTVRLIDVYGKTAKNDTRPLGSTITVKVKTGFFARLIAFFKGLFGLLPTYEIK